MIIAFTISGRPQYLTRTLDSWSRVRGIGNAQLRFRVEPGCDEALARCLDVDFAAKAVSLNTTRLGVIANPYRVLEESFSRPDGGFVVLADEDVVVSEDVLEYFAWAQAAYRGDGELGAVCTHTLGSDQGPDQVFRAQWFDPVMWGTWRDRWTDVIEPTWAGVRGNLNAWDRNLIEVFRRQGRKCLFPCQSRSDHIGELGVHTTPGPAFRRTVSQCFAPSRPPQEYAEIER